MSFWRKNKHTTAVLAWNETDMATVNAQAIHICLIAVGWRYIVGLNSAKAGSGYRAEALILWTTALTMSTTETLTLARWKLHLHSLFISSFIYEQTPRSLEQRSSCKDLKYSFLSWLSRRFSPRIVESCYAVFAPLKALKPFGFFRTLWKDFIASAQFLRGRVGGEPLESVRAKHN